MKIKNWDQFKNVNESWKSFVAGCMLLFAASCDGVKMHDNSGREVNLPYYNSEHKYTTTGTVQDVTRVPMKNATQYEIIIIDDSTGNTLQVDKYAMNPLPDDETPSLWWASNLKKGSKVKLVCGTDCKVYLCK